VKTGIPEIPVVTIEQLRPDMIVHALRATADLLEKGDLQWKSGALVISRAAEPLTSIHDAGQVVIASNWHDRIEIFGDLVLVPTGKVKERWEVI
jgi:hypothetical protein